MTPVFKVDSIVMEASSKEDRDYMKTMNKEDIHQINGTLVQNLYGSVMKRKNIDFGDIPDSKGDIEKVKYYDSIMESLNVLTEIFRKNNINDGTVSEIKQCISNMKMFKNQFMTGFRTNHEFIMITYNAMVMAIVDATTSVTSWYIDYIVSTPNIGTPINLDIKQGKKRGLVSLDNIRKFNSACDNGNMAKTLNYLIDQQKKGFVGADDVIITGIIVMGLLSIVPIIRELIFFYYHSRVKISDYLEMQSEFLEMNKLAIESSGKGPKEKKEILRKQDKIVKKMRRTADKLAINNVDTNDVVKKELKNENSIWSLDNIEKQIAKTKMDTAGGGFSVL